MPSDSGRQANADETYITPQMLEAGKKALQEWYDEGAWWDEGARRVYLAMSAAGKANKVG